ncbi:MAG: DUF4296 domain-containing protein [Chitinophagaceae bacterium]
MKKTILFAFMFLGMGACTSDKLPKDVMTPDELKSVLWDLFVAGEMRMSDTTTAVRLHLKDSATSSFNYVLQIHKLGKDAFMHSFKYYQRHPDQQNILIDTLIAYNDRQVKLYEKRILVKDSLNGKKPDTAKRVDPSAVEDAAKKDTLGNDTAKLLSLPKQLPPRLPNERMKSKVKSPDKPKLEAY